MLTKIRKILLFKLERILRSWADAVLQRLIADKIVVEDEDAPVSAAKPMVDPYEQEQHRPDITDHEVVSEFGKELETSPSVTAGNVVNTPDPISLLANHLKNDVDVFPQAMPVKLTDTNEKTQVTIPAIPDSDNTTYAAMSKITVQDKTDIVSHSLRSPHNEQQWVTTKVLNTITAEKAASVDIKNDLPVLGDKGQHESNLFTPDKKDYSYTSMKNDSQSDNFKTDVADEYLHDKNIQLQKAKDLFADKIGFKNACEEDVRYASPFVQQNKLFSHSKPQPTRSDSVDSTAMYWPELTEPHSQPANNFNNNVPDTGMLRWPELAMNESSSINKVNGVKPLAMHSYAEYYRERMHFHDLDNEQQGRVWNA